MTFCFRIWLLEAVDVSLELGKLRVIQPGCTHHAGLGGERIGAGLGGLESGSAAESVRGFPQLGLADLFVQHQWLAALGVLPSVEEKNLSVLSLGTLGLQVLLPMLGKTRPGPACWFYSG